MRRGNYLRVPAVQLRRVQQSSEGYSLAQRDAVQLFWHSVAQVSCCVALMGAAQLRRVQFSLAQRMQHSSQGAAQLIQDQRSCDGQGDTQRHVWHVHQSKKMGAHSAWQRTCRQNILEVSEKTNRKENRKLSVFSFEPFRRRENNSEFRSMELKKKQLSEFRAENPSAEEKTTQNSFLWNKNRS